MRRVVPRSLGIGLALLALAGPLPTLVAVAAQDEVRETPPDVERDEDTAALQAAFTEAMTNVKLVGVFTVDGADEGRMQRDEYTISSVTKAPKGDLWIVSARMRYGNVDVTLPVPVEVQWAGKTPMIILDRVTIPGLGTFSSRVLIDGTRYAGTWQHDAVGGHMFGKIEPTGEPAAPAAAPAKE